MSPQERVAWLLQGPGDVEGRHEDSQDAEPRRREGCKSITCILLAL